jgi:hypothetical protein
MDKEKEKILNKIRRKLTLDSDFMDECASYDNMDDMLWDMPPGFEMRPEIRKRVSTDAHDILKTAVNLFDTHNPKWEILPRGPADASAAEELERWLEWHMAVADQNGDKPSSTERLKHSAKYGKVASQLDFLPYWTAKDSDEYRDAMANPFCITVHPIASVHYERGKYDLRWVSKVNNVPAGDVIDHWDAYRTDSTYGKKIESAIAKVEELLEEDEEACLMYVDYTSKDKRWCFAYPYEGSGVDMDLNISDEGLIEFVWGDNKLGFINWAISEAASTPLLYSLHKGGIWENQCFLDTIADTTVIRRGWWPLFKHKSNSNKSMEVDFSGNEAVIELNAADGEEVEVLIPPPLDPGIRELMDRNTNKGASATGLKNLQNLNTPGNVQYATASLYINMSKATLDPYLTCYQHNNVGLAKLAFMWVKKTGITVTGYRTKDKDKNANKVKGEKINVGPDAFDPSAMMIRCELLPTNPSDALQRMNEFSQAIQIGLPITKKNIAERMGYGEGDVLEQDWLKEKMQEIALAMYQKQKDAELTMQVQQAQMQMQMQAQQAQMQAQQAQMQGQTPAPEGPGGMVPPGGMGGANMMPGGMGNDPNQGGIPAAMSDPGETRTQTQEPG